MYEYISGVITKVNPKYIVVDNSGIGYQIFVPSSNSNNVDIDNIYVSSIQVYEHLSSYH